MNNLKSNANGMLNMLKGGNNAVSLLFICAVLQACGGESNNPSSSENPVTPPVTTSVALYTSDTYSTSYEDTPSEVVLDPYVKASDGSQPVLVDVRSLSSGVSCEDIDVGSDRFSVEVGQPGVCVYEYTVANQTERTLSAARSRVLESGTSVVTVSAKTASSSASAPLPVISEIAELGEVIDIHLVNPGEMTLSNDVTLLGYGQVVSVDTVEEVITFQAGTSEADTGVSRIYYHYSDADGYVRSGWIDIAVSESTYNTAPNAQNFYYLTEQDAENGKNYSTINEGETIKVDVSPYIGDVDGQELQLIDVQAFNAEARLVDAVDYSNTSFTFMSNTPGKYQVSYTVSDHHGGYSSAIVEIYVDGAWQDVIIAETKDVFAAPLSAVAASVADYDMAGAANEDEPPLGNGVLNVPLYDWDTANAICIARGGSLPTREQWEDFIAQEGNPYLLDDTAGSTVSDWPIAAQYWSSTEDGDTHFYTANLSDTPSIESQAHGIGGSDKPYLGYLACIDKTPTSLVIVAPSTVAAKSITQLTTEFVTASGLYFPYTKPVTWSYEAPDDPGLEVIPDLETNVDLGTYSGELVTYDKGYLQVSAIDLTGELKDKTVIRSVDNLIFFGDQKPNFELEGAQEQECSEDVLVKGKIWTLSKHDDYGMRINTTYSHASPTANDPTNITDYQVSIRHQCEAIEGDSYIEFYGHRGYSGSSYNSSSWSPAVYFDLDPSVDYSQFSEVKISFWFRATSETIDSISEFTTNDMIGIYGALTDSTADTMSGSLVVGRNDFGFVFDDYYDGTAVAISRPTQDYDPKVTELYNGWRRGQAILPIEEGETMLRVQVRFGQSSAYPGAIQVDDIQVTPVFE